MDTCKHCGRTIVLGDDGVWIDPEATGDDSVWRETCDSHDTFQAEHEPRPFDDTVLEAFGGTGRRDEPDARIAQILRIEAREGGV